MTRASGPWAERSIGKPTRFATINPPHVPEARVTNKFVPVVKPPPMSITCNRIAGQSVERLAALSDGNLWRGDGALRGELIKLLPGLAVYMMNFITLGIFWVWQQTQLNHLSQHRGDRAGAVE